MNEVNLLGFIVGIRKEKTITRITLKVQTGEDANFPIVHFSTPSKRELADTFKKGDIVSVKAKIKPAFERGDSDKVVFYKQELEAISIEKVARTKETKEETDIFLLPTREVQHINEAILEGEIVNTKKNNNMFSILLCPDNEVNSVWLSCYAYDKVNELEEKLTPGKKIKVIGELQTKITGEKGNTKRFENIIAKKIGKSK